MVDFEQLTDPQTQAASAYDRNYAVTAGAGSGKTTTFTMRYLTVLEETAADPESIAAITFTESGAQELEERVRETISTRLRTTQSTEAYDQWRAYSDALADAYIHTIHGFCSRLLSEYALQADVPIGFDVIEDTAAQGQRISTVEQFIETHLDDARVAALTDIYYRDRLEEILIDLLTEQERAAQWASTWATRDPEEYVSFIWDQYASIAPAAARSTLTDTAIQAALQDIATVSAEAPDAYLRKGIADSVADVVESYGSEVASMDDKTVHDMAAALGQALTSSGTAFYGSFDAWPYTAADEWSASISTRYEDGTTTLTTELPIEAWATPDRMQVTHNAAPYYIRLASLFEDLYATYQADKRAEEVLDFSDLIQETLTLLRTQPELRATLREQFEYIMLDEVQDTDPRQWELVQLLTSITDTYDNCNVFVVGDEKQSIFRFRGADVGQFRQERTQLDAANDSQGLPPDEPTEATEARGLARNFRSLPAVLQPVNDLFDELFGTVPDAYQSPPTGISATTDFEPAPQRLTPDRSDPADLATETTFVVVPEEESLRADVLSEDHPLATLPADGALLDARALAGEVSSLLADDTERYATVGIDDGTPVEEPTDLAPSDIAILLRKRTHLKRYERALAELNIPYTVASGIGFYDSTEITALRNLFEVLVDPTADLALFGVLRSPLFGFTDEKILQLWEDINPDQIQQGALWQALAESTADELQTAHDCLLRWRAAAGLTDDAGVVETWDRWLSQIIEDTGYLAAVAIDERGQQAVANVEKLRARLRSWSEDGVQTLPGILDRIEREAELSTREGEAEVPADADGVRIMTIHDAKGREFPAVFVPGITGGFNMQTGYGGGIVEFETVRDGGEQTPLVGLRAPSESDAYEQTDTILKRRLKFARKREAIAEEKRILYVAMTRARDHLCLVGTASTDDDTRLDDLKQGDPADPSKWYDLLAPVWLSDDIQTELADRGQATLPATDRTEVTVRLPKAGAEQQPMVADEPPELATDLTPSDRPQQYQLPASSLQSLLSEEAAGQVTVDHTGQYLSYTPPEHADATSGPPASGDATQLPRNIFGTAVHKAVERRIDATDTETLRTVLEQCAVHGDASPDAVTPAVVTELEEHVSTARSYIASLPDGAVADERSVTVSLPSGEVYGDIDHLVVTEDAFHIVDYKTNQLQTAAAAKTAATQYQWQLRAYAVALHQTDPDRAVTASLVFTDVDADVEYSWAPADLEALETTLDSEIRQSLPVEL